MKKQYPEFDQHWQDYPIDQGKPPHFMGLFALTCVLAAIAYLIMQGI